MYQVEHLISLWSKKTGIYWKKQRRKTGFKGLQWTNVISKGLKTVYPYCSIAFKRHRLKVPGPIKAGPEFWSLGYCRFDDCPVTVTVSVQSEADLKATVKFQGEQSIQNRTELKRRPVRADLRNTLGQELIYVLPRAMYLQKLAKLDEALMESVCRDDAPTPQVLRNISWQETKKQPSAQQRLS